MQPTLTSYEAERLVNRRIGNKSVEQQSYYALPEEADFDDEVDPKKNKRGKTRFLIREQRELVDYPSVWLAEKYDYKAYYGQELFKIRKDIKQLIKEDIDKVAKETGIPTGSLGAKQLLSLLIYMDASISEEECELPERLPSDEDLDTLVNMAIASPAVCLYRALDDVEDSVLRIELARTCCDQSFVSMFNRPESRSIMDAVFEGRRGSSEEKHYEQVFIYYLLKDDEVVYVGQTTQGLTRPFHHDGWKDFDEVRIVHCEPNQLNVFESVAIEKYKPIYNKSAGVSNCSLNSARTKVRELTGRSDIYLPDVKKAMKALGIEPYLIDMTPRIHASDIVKIADYISMEV